MSNIRVVFTVAPANPADASSQHPDAAWYHMGQYWVCATDGQPTQAQLDAFLGLDAAGVAAVARLSVDETERTAARVDSQILALINQTKAEWNTWAQANFPSLTAIERTRLGVLFWVVSVAVRRLLRNGGG